MLVSDAAAYMMKAGKDLKILHPKMNVLIPSAKGDRAAGHDGSPRYSNTWDRAFNNF